MGQVKKKLEIRERRIFSESLKKSIVKDLVSKRLTMKSASLEHQVSHQTLYRWLYKYSVGYEPRRILVVQMESEEKKSHELRQRISELERAVGQKQLELDFLNKLLEVGSKELGFDLKKSFSSRPLSGTGTTSSDTSTS